MTNKWTATEDLLKKNQVSNEKKKWQIALRRYIIDKKPSKNYAPFFGIDIETFRKWIELQFNNELNWENFGSSWQFEHIIPVIYFSADKNDQKLCWNFTNIFVSSENNIERDILSAKTYFQTLWEQTGYFICRLMLEKITEVESNLNYKPQLSFFETYGKGLSTMVDFDETDFERLNKGETLKDLLYEKEILSKFGS